ncbi:hypothetical protein [Nonomuraea sp. NPDC049784]|uniref:hypothetical protein n=1 Tax=Nonomuraea sp. NPDC049784 TaxID=3154361 RepID=UPI0033ED16F8
MAELAPDENEDPAAQLLRLGGLKIQYFHDAIRAGEGDRRACTSDDPKNAPGSRDYFARMRTLRQRLRKELQWKPFDLSNLLPLVVNPDKTLAIGVVLGDAYTGVPGPRHPRSKRPLGEIKQGLVEQNRQGALFDLPAGPNEAVLTDDELADLETYFLVTHRRVTNDKVIVQCEVSKAVELDPQNYAFRWRPRICLPPLEFEGVIDYIEGTDDGPTEFEVHIDEH